MRDIFHTLWRPRGIGVLSKLLFRQVWRLGRLLGSRGGKTIEMAGPVGMLLCVLVWTVLVVIGFALIYLPHMPSGFHYGTSLDPLRTSDLPAAAYLSLVVLATLGLGDITPSQEVLRLVLPIEALIGFVLLTAGISWVLQIYPALTRRRTLAQQLSLMAQTDTLEVARTGEVSVACDLLGRATQGITTVEADYMQYFATYFFSEFRSSHALAASLPYAVRLAEAGGQAPAREVRHAAAMLTLANDSLARTLDRNYLSTGGGTEQVFAAFTRDHQEDSVLDRRDDATA